MTRFSAGTVAGTAGGSVALGTFEESVVASRDLYVSASNGGFRFRAPTGASKVLTARFHCNAVNTAGSYHCEIWSDGDGSPGSQVGSDSDSVALAADSDLTFTFPADVNVSASTLYWIVLVKEDGAGDFNTVADQGSGDIGSGRHNTITSIGTAGLPSSEDWRCEVVVLA